MTKVKKSQAKLAHLAARFKEEHNDLYDQAYAKTLQDAFDTDHETNESFRRLRSRNCNSCLQLSAFFYANVCWRCHYAKEFYDREEAATKSYDRILERSQQSFDRHLKRQSSAELSSLFQNISLS